MIKKIRSQIFYIFVSICQIKISKKLMKKIKAPLFLFFLKNWRDAENYESLNGKIADYISKLEPNTASATLRGKKDDGSPALLVFIKLGKEKWNQECLADYFISEIVGGSAILKTCKI